MPAVILTRAIQSVSLLSFALGATAGLYWLVKGFRLLRRKNLILNTPTSTVQSAAMGLVEISGLATSPYVMLSPLDRAECYYYRSVAWQLQPQGGSGEWVKVAEETLNVPFYIDDSTGKILVDPRGAQIDLHCDSQQEYHRSLSSSGTQMPGSIAEFLLRYGVDPDQHIKVEEYCIKPKTSLFVLGTLCQNPGLDVSLTPAWAQRAKGTGELDGDGVEVVSKLTQVIRLSEQEAPVPATAMTQQQKIAAALNKAGIANPATWNSAAAGAKAAKEKPANSSVAVEAAPHAESHNEIEEKETFDFHPPIVLMKGNHQPSFLVSWRSQRELLKSHERKSGFMFWGGLVLTLTCIYLFARFHGF